MILVTAAAGKTGRAVVRALASGGERVRALIHRPQQAAALEALGADEVVSGDIRLPETLARAVDGVRALYLICPNVSPDELRIGRAVIDAARTAGVGRLIYHSVLHPQVEAMPHHWLKLRVEEQLFESGLPFTILQPAAYMQNLLPYWPRIVDEGVHAIPYSVETRLGMVDLEDVAAVAALVLGEPGHEGATYELAGTEAPTQAELAALLSQQLGRPVRAESVPQEQWAQQARAGGLGDYAVETLLAMFRYYERHGFWGNPNVLGWLLGRLPTTLSAFIERTKCSLS